MSTDGTHLRIAIKSEPGAPPEPPAPEGAPQLPEGYEHVMQQELYAAVVPDSLKVSPGGAKIEITLAKADPSINWGTLHKSGTVAAPNWSTPQDPAAARQYPSSFRRNPKDWSMLEGELQEMEKKGELEDGDPLQVNGKVICPKQAWQWAQSSHALPSKLLRPFVRDVFVGLVHSSHVVGVQAATANHGS